MAEDPATRGRLDDPDAIEAAANAYWGWVGCAQNVPGIPVRELFRVLDAADRWLTATGHRDWRANILTERASIHDRLGETDAAIAAAEEALTVATQHQDAPGYKLSSYRYTLADLFIKAERHSAAVPYIQAILDDHDNEPIERSAAHEALARCALAADDTGTARREARTAVTLAEPMGDDALVDTLDTLVEALQADGDLDAAWRIATRYMEVAERIGGHYQPYYATWTAVDVALARADLATAGRLLGELDEHATALDAATGTKYIVETARLHRRLASALDGEGKSYQEALARLTRAMEVDPKSAEATANRGETYRLMGRYEEALTDLTRAIDLDPKYAWAMSSRGETYRRMNRYEEALTDLTRAIDLDPKYTWAIGSRGSTYRLMGRYEEALTDLTRAIDLDPKSAWNSANRGETYRLMGRYEEALTDLTRAIDLDPKYTWAIGSRGSTYRLMGRYEEALTDLTRAIDLDPKYTWVIAAYGVTLRCLGRLDEALAAHDKAITLDRGDSSVHNSRGLTLLALGHAQEALASFDQALTLNPSDGVPHENRGIVLAATGHLDRALHEFDAACRLQPGGAGEGNAWAGAILWHQRQPAKARDRFMQVNGRVAGCTPFHTAEMEAISLCALGDPVSAEQHLLTAIPLRAPGTGQSRERYTTCCWIHRSQVSIAYAQSSNRTFERTKSSNAKPQLEHSTSQQNSGMRDIKSITGWIAAYLEALA